MGAMEYGAAVEDRDLDALDRMLSDEVTFRSPSVHAPYQGKMPTMVILRAMARILKDFHYTRSFTEDDGFGAVLVFEATINGLTVEGADYLRFDDRGLVADLRIMLRPQTGLEGLTSALGPMIERVMREQGFSAR